MMPIIFCRLGRAKQNPALILFANNRYFTTPLTTERQYDTRDRSS
ncbi:hypothetical protein [Nostoc sp.]